MSKKQQYQHWRLETDADKILWLYFDRKEASVNTINRAVMEELNTIVDSIAKNIEYKGMILASAKKSGFVAGADISQFNQFKDIEEAVSLLKEGQVIFDKMEALKIPTVAMIQGFCVGGGLELALACHYRVVEEGSKTRLGFPEVKLGIHPGWGGTIRLPKLIGAPQAMNLILSGHTVTGKAAAKLGFADAAIPKRELVRAAKFYASGRAKPRQANPLQKLTNSAFSRRFLYYFMRQQLRKKANPLQYPAPFQVLDNWERFGVYTPEAMEREAKTCGKLFFSETSQNLVRVFFLQDRLKGLAKDNQFSPTHVHVIGAGTMGGDIAAWCAFQGFYVTLQDRTPALIAPALKRAYQLFKEKLKEGYLVQKAMDRLMPDVQGVGIAHADVIIEAVYEDLAAKQAIFKDVESRAKPAAILATNTSSIPLDEINTVLKSPERLVGIHFFNPVSKMQLIEIVMGKRTSTSVVENAVAFVRKLDHLPLPVKSSPGFLVNRILMPYLLEALVLLEEGIPANMIDKAMIEFGMPMGPVALADTVGLDVCLSVANHLIQYFPKTTIPKLLVEKVEKKKLGRKTNEGFYVYKNGRQVETAILAYDKPLSEISDRLIACMLKEAFACLDEKIVADGDLLDAGMVFGTGFAPFRGGPIHYAKAQGIVAERVTASESVT